MKKSFAKISRNIFLPTDRTAFSGHINIWDRNDSLTYWNLNASAGEQKFWRTTRAWRMILLVCACNRIRVQTRHDRVISPVCFQGKIRMGFILWSKWREMKHSLCIINTLAHFHEPSTMFWRRKKKVSPWRSSSEQTDLLYNKISTSCMEIAASVAWRNYPLTLSLHKESDAAAL